MHQCVGPECFNVCGDYRNGLLFSMSWQIHTSIDLLHCLAMGNSPEKKELWVCCLEWQLNAGSPEGQQHPLTCIEKMGERHFAQIRMCVVLPGRE